MFHSCASIKYRCGDAEIDSRHHEMLDCLGEIHRAVAVEMNLNLSLLRRLAEEFSDLCSVHEMAEQVLTVEHNHFFDHSLIFNRTDDLIEAVKYGGSARDLADIADSLHVLLIADIITDQAEIRLLASEVDFIGLDDFGGDLWAKHPRPATHCAFAS